MDPGRLPPALIAALGLAHACDLGPCLTSWTPCETRGTCDTATGPCLTVTVPTDSATTDSADTGDTSPTPSTGHVRLELLDSDRLPPDVVERLRARGPR